MRKHPAYNGKEHVSWYSYVKDNDGLAEDEICLESLSQTTTCCQMLLDKEAAKVGHAQVYLAGRGQGCNTALHAALTYTHDVGGVLACHGHVLTSTEVPA